MKNDRQIGICSSLSVVSFLYLIFLSKKLLVLLPREYGIGDGFHPGAYA